MTWNQFVEYVNSKLTNEQKNYEIDYIDFSIIYDELGVYINNDDKDIAIH